MPVTLTAHHRVPIAVADLIDRAARSADSRVFDDDVDPTERCIDGLAKPGDVLGYPDIA